MAFEPQYPVTREPHIREMVITLLKTIEENLPHGGQSVEFRIAIDDQAGHLMNHQHGDLLPHAPQAIKDALQSIMDWAWNKAQEEVIP